jgi:hypothetical protein
VYKIPLSPIDLTQIYKKKQDDPTYTLSVDYTESKKDLEPEHILIYLANTGFRSSFDKIDGDLVKAYLELGFLIDAPTLTRVVSNIIRMEMEEDIEDSLEIFSLEQLNYFIDENKSLVDDLILQVSSMPLYAMNNINNFEESEVHVDHGYDLKLKEGESKIGLNLLNIFTSAYDAVLIVLANRGMSAEIDTSIFNDSSKYYGSDLMNNLNNTGVLSNIMALIPEEMIVKNPSVE